MSGYRIGERGYRVGDLVEFHHRPGEYFMYYGRGRWISMSEGVMCFSTMNYTDDQVVVPSCLGEEYQVEEQEYVDD